MASYPHLHVRGLGVNSKSFRAPGFGRFKPPPPPENREEHGAKLIGDLKKAADYLQASTNAQKGFGVPANRRGMMLAIDGREDALLHVSATARSASRGLKLLNAQRARRVLDGNEEINTDLATFFVAKNTIASMTNALDRYSAWEDTNDDFKDLVGSIDEEEADRRRPTNFWLFETASGIRPATLTDLWTDDIDKFPRRSSAVEWEVWTRRDYTDIFTSAVARLEIRRTSGLSEFVDTDVTTVISTPEQMQSLMMGTGAIIALRSASSFTSDFMRMAPSVRANTVEAVAARMGRPPAGAPRLALLDTGVNSAHPLLQPALRLSDCHAVRDDLDVIDHSGHGSRMAGVALFKDLGDVANGRGSIDVPIRLESVVVVSPDPATALPARDALQSAVSVLEDSHDGARVFCLAQTADGEPETGEPSSTSAVLDQLAFNDGSATRLFCVATGNVRTGPDERYLASDYDNRNRRHSIQAPAQALNALSVGAMTNKVNDGEQLLAPAGDLAPTSRTAQDWTITSLTKPDIVMEGGNFKLDEGGVFADPDPDSLILTTSHHAGNRPFAMTGESSAATAQASALAARLLARYPDLRMETLRGMMVHSAEWTSAMMDQLIYMRLGSASATDTMATFLSRYGWGVPNEERLFSSSDNEFTMIAEDELQPYELSESGNVRLKQMKYFKLPWPTEVLRDLRQTEVEMKCTLSYFIEPDPYAATRDRLERYPSHRLKFDVKRFGESDRAAQSRFNAMAEDDGTKGTDDGWLLGSRLSHRGTVHQDIWRGPAFRLATRDGVSVAPIRGWWGDVKQAERYKEKVRFSLIVSVRVPAGRGNIYSAVQARVPAGKLVSRPVASV